MSVQWEDLHMNCIRSSNNESSVHRSPLIKPAPSLHLFIYVGKKLDTRGKTHGPSPFITLTLDWVAKPALFVAQLKPTLFSFALRVSVTVHSLLFHMLCCAFDTGCMTKYCPWKRPSVGLSWTSTLVLSLPAAVSAWYWPWHPHQLCWLLPTLVGNDNECQYSHQLHPM